MRGKSGRGSVVVILVIAGIGALFGLLPSGNVGSGQLPGILAFAAILVGGIWLLMWGVGKIFGGGDSKR